MFQIHTFIPTFVKKIPPLITTVLKSSEISDKPYDYCLYLSCVILLKCKKTFLLLAKKTITIFFSLLDNDDLMINKQNNSTMLLFKNVFEVPFFQNFIRRHVTCVGQNLTTG